MRLLSDIGLLAAMICTSTVSAAWAAEPAAKEKVQSAAPAKDQRIATILEVKVLCKQPGRYIGWPSIAQAPNGDLLAVFSGDREAHVSPDGKTQMVRSSDGGKTWSEPVTINDLAVDDRDAGILRTAKGTMLVSWFTGPPYGSPLEGNYVIRSSDNGKTWSQPIRTQVTTPHGPIQLADGRLLTIGQRPHCSHTRGSGRPYDGPPGTTAYTVSIEESRDDGLSWTVISTFPVPKDANMLSFDEAHMVEIEPGKLVALFRDCHAPDHLRQSESSDGGLTWSAPRVTPILGHPPHVIRLVNGWLLTVYGRRHVPFAECACISKDQGKTWLFDDEITLAFAPNGDIGYPASVQLEDGSVWTVYYQIDKPGEKPCLMGTHWRLKETTDVPSP